MENIKEWYDNRHTKDVFKSSDTFYKYVASNINGKYLDISCGTGFMFKFTQGIGCDFSVRALEICSKRYPESSFVLCDAHNIPFRDESFDAISCLGSLEHYKDQEKVLKEIYRILKDKKRCFLTITNRLRWTSVAHLFMNFKERQPIEKGLSIKESTFLLNQTGFKLEKVIKPHQFTEYGPFTGNFGWIIQFFDRILPVDIVIEPLYICKR